MHEEEKLIVDGVGRLLNQFADEFVAQPYRYWQEIDVQVALASRIDAFLRTLGLDLVLGNYPRALPGFEGKQLWSRVSCEPSIWMKWQGKEIRCNPDIVIWKQLADENDPPDQRENWRGNWPMLWACEIKVDDVKKTGWDEGKLVQLLRNSDELEFGCIIDISRKRRAESKVMLTKEDGRLQILKFSLPELPLDKPDARNEK